MPIFILQKDKDDKNKNLPRVAILSLYMARFVPSHGPFSPFDRSRGTRSKCRVSNGQPRLGRDSGPSLPLPGPTCADPVSVDQCIERVHERERRGLEVPDTKISMLQVEQNPV
jgi:hypothetical protein